MKKLLTVLLCMTMLMVSLVAVAEDENPIVPFEAGLYIEQEREPDVSATPGASDEDDILIESLEEEVREIETQLYNVEDPALEASEKPCKDEFSEETSEEIATDEAAMASASGSYIINGKTVTATMVADPGNGQCWEYANRIYNIIWGTRFDSSFTGNSGTGHNMLRNLGDSDRTLTAEHLKAFIGEAALGASIRIGGCTSSCTHFNDDGLACGHSGHNLILVAKSDSGFTTFERLTGPGRREKSWTWDSFCSAYAAYPYIKYIKWPGAGEYGGNASPIACLDFAVASEGKLYIRGWAFDPNTTSQSLAIHAYVRDSTGSMIFIGATTANTYRPDVNDVYNCGAYHGFDSELYTKDLDGIYTVCVAALDTDNGPARWVEKQGEQFAKDNTTPSISNVAIDNITSTGYRITVTVTDNLTVANVKVPTWRQSLGGNKAEWLEATQVNEETWVCDVKCGKEEQTYYSDIYAYDYQGNVSKATGTIQHSNLIVSFDANGGTCSMRNKEIAAMWYRDTPLQTYGVLPMPVKQNYSFIGWNMETTDSMIADNSPVTYTENHTLFAVWQKQATPPLADTLYFTGSLDLQNYIGMNAYIHLPEGDNPADYTASYSYKSYIQKKNGSYSFAGKTTKAVMCGDQKLPCYKIDLVHAGSDEMVDEATVVVYKNGKEVGRKTYSIRNLAMDALAKGGLDPDLETLYRALLQYGHYAQRLFNNNTSDLPSIEGAPDLKQIPSSYAPAGDPKLPAASVTGFTASLALDTSVDMNVYLDIASGSKLSDFTIKVLDQYGRNYTGFTTPKLNSKGQIYFKIEGIYADQMSDAFKIVVTDKNGSSAAWTRSLMTCAYNTSQKGVSQNPNKRAVVLSLYRYHLAAKDWFV